MGQAVVQMSLEIGSIFNANQQARGFTAAIFKSSSAV
jgi:hypothetical protein